ncbi:MAG: LysR family transcriptional regulator [Proteobacteria bacterium]|nr:LysR family transcriptional regulator [Pseudomonadota bacterium]
MPDLRPNCRLWLFCEEHSGVFGDGKVRLLQEIDRCGCLRQAARNLEISYRKAWGDLKKAEECLGVQLIERSRGGKSGGQSLLTDDGRRWIEAYAAFLKALHAHMDEDFAAHMQPLLKGNNV